MYLFKTEVLSNYKDSDKILNFIYNAECNPHQLKRCDGSLSIYYKCKYIQEIDSMIAKYGENLKWYRGTYSYAKRLIRKTVQKIREWEKCRI